MAKINPYHNGYKVTKVITYSNDSDPVETHYLYDRAKSRIIRYYYSKSTEFSGASGTHLYEVIFVDSLGRPSGGFKTVYDGSIMDFKIYYDSVGNLSRYTDRYGARESLVINFNYENKLLTLANGKFPELKHDYSNQYEYDSIGRIIKMVGELTAFFNYNSNGQISNVETHNKGNIPYKEDRHLVNSDYSYDNSGNLLKIVSTSSKNNSSVFTNTTEIQYELGEDDFFNFGLLKLHTDPGGVFKTRFIKL